MSGRGKRGGARGRGGRQPTQDREKEKEEGFNFEDSEVVPSDSGSTLPTTSTTSTSTTTTTTVIEIEPKVHQQSLVPVHIFIYFLADFPKEQPTIVPTDGTLQVRAVYDNHCLWAEVLAPRQKELSFKVKVGTREENKRNWESYIPTNVRTIPAQHIKEGMLYLDFNNEHFDKTYSSNTTSRITSITPYEIVSMFLAARCGPTQFSKELQFLMGKMKEKTSHYCLNADFRTFIHELENLSTNKLLLESEVFVKSIIIARCLAKNQIPLQNRFVSLDVLKNSLGGLTEFPDEIFAAQEYRLSGNGRATEGMFLLVSALALSFNDRNEATNFASRYQVTSKGVFTKEEIEVLSAVDWTKSKRLKASNFCGSLAMGQQIGQLESVIEVIFTNENRLKTYSDVIKQMDAESYLAEWKYCLSVCPPIERTAIPFSLTHEKILSKEGKIQNQAEVEYLLSEFLKGREMEYECIWVLHLAQHIVRRMNRQANSVEERVSAFLSLTRKLQSNNLLVKEFHGLLPKEVDSSILTRVKELIKTDPESLLFKLENDAISQLISKMSKEFLLGFHDSLLKLIAEPCVVPLYELCWSKLIAWYIRDIDFSVMKQGYIRKAIREPTDYSDSDLFYYLASQQIYIFFNYAYDAQAVPDRMEILEKDANTLVDCINEFDVLPELIPVLSEKVLLDRLQYLVGDAEINFNQLKKKYTDINQDWSSFLDSLLIMRDCEQFAEEADKEFTEYSSKYKALDTKKISQWYTPNCHPQLRRVSERLTQLKDSVFFSYKWGFVCLGQSAAESDRDLTERWVEYFEIYFGAWKQLMKEIEMGSVDLSTIKTIFARTIQQLGSGSRSKVLTSTEAEVRQELDKLTRASKEELEQIVEKEVELATSIMSDAKLEKGTVFQMIFDCVNAVVIADDIISLKELYERLDISVSPAISLFCDIFSKDAAKTPFGTVVACYTDLVNFLPNLRQLIRGFPSLFLDVIYTHDLLKVLSMFNDVPALSARIDTRQGEDIREETHDILHALRLLCDSHSILQHPVYGKIRNKARITPEELISFFVSCGGSVVALAILQDKMKKGGAQVVREALQSDSEEKQTITIVKNLLVNGGVFLVRVKDGKVLVSATYTDPSRPQEILAITPEELEALPSQLLLTSGVTTKNQSSYDVDAPLPENIARLEDRECYVLRFNKLFDTTFLLAEVLQKLCASGHPDYQEKEFSFECRLTIAELLKFVHEREELLLRWRNLFEMFRDSHPILSFLSRSQMVSCLSAIRLQKFELLFSTLQSVGCLPSLMGKELEKDMATAQNINKASDLFDVLAKFLEKYFDTQKLRTPVTVALPKVPHPLENVDANFRLVRVMADHNLEEVVCGAHIAIHRRTPCPVELLFCTPNMNEVDVEDFLDRWALFARTNVAAAGVTFWLVKIEDLPYPTQTRCMQKLFKIVEELPKKHPKLFFVMKGDQKTYISTVLARDETKIGAETCDALCDSLIRPIAASLKNIYVAHSRNCGEGKTTSIIKNLVVDKTDALGRPVLHAQFSVDTTPMEVILKRLLKARPMTDDRGLVIHFNVGHQVNAKDANLFLFQYLLVSSWRDSHGYTFPRHEKDVIVVELCNTGKEDERERIPICKYFQELPLESGISYVTVHPQPHRSSKLFYSWIADPDAYLRGSQMLMAIYNAMTKGEKTLHYHSEIASIKVADDSDMEQIVKSIASENFCARQHLMLPGPTPPTSSMNCTACKGAITPDYTQTYMCCKSCNQGLCNACMAKLPVSSSSEALFLRRYFRFAVTQLQNFFHAFEDVWNFATMGEFMEDAGMYSKMAYQYCRIILLCAKNLAKPAMEPFDERYPLDDVRRCANMSKFEDWRETPFFLVTQKDYHVTSTSRFSPLEFMQQHDPSRDFRLWLSAHQQYLNPINRQKLQHICSSLSARPYSVDQKNPPLKVLLEILGCFEGARPVLNALESLSDRKLGTTPLQQVASDVEGAISFLEDLGEKVDRSMSCSQFMTKCSEYLNSIFGNPAKKPQYTLTADNILRIMAVQSRLISGIPVCIMGETGCGKTETLSFLAKVSGKEFCVINVQEGMSERDFSKLMKPIVKKANEACDRQIVVVLDEVNATSALWTAKDMLCDHICFGVRLPVNIVFVVILNPWKVRSPKQEAAIAEMDVGGLDFLKYQQNANKNESDETQGKKALNLVYQVHKSPETLYSLVWDWGSSSTTETPLDEIKGTFTGSIVVQDRAEITDEMLMAKSMVSWLIRKLSEIPELRANFKKAGDGTEGEAYWMKFRTLLVELLLASQQFLRHDVYLDEISVVSLRDIRKACELIYCVFENFYCRVVAELQKEDLLSEFAYFDWLTNAVHVALVNTYCLRLDSDRRLKYLVRIVSRWSTVRSWFAGSQMHPAFMPDPSTNIPSYNECDLYKSFNDLAMLIVRDLDVENGIAINQALKENTFAVLCAVYTNSTLFIVGRPGSTKSRTLELLVKATEDNSRREETFLGKLGIVIQKHVIQCSPYTTAHHVHSNARRAAMAQIAASKIQHSSVRRINVIVLEEVGATIGSVHNPLMSLHSMIDHGVEVNGQNIRLPIIGVSNYRLDASKMGRGRVVYRGNPPVNDLEITARAILRGLGESKSADWISNYSLAFSENILRNENYTWYYGMRDFYATVSSIRILATPLEQSLHLRQLSRAFKSEINSHITRWAVLINLRGFPDREQEMKLANAMQNSFGLSPNVLAKWEWKSSEDADPILLCDCCCRMKMYREALVWQTQHPDKELTDAMLSARFTECATPVMISDYCKYFDNENQLDLPAAEVISYSIRETTSRHVMVFTKANAALLILFSMGLVRRDQCTVIFQSSASKDHMTTASELVQQMMRIKACMREGKTLILVKSRHLYESMLDALNVHYTKDRSSDDSDNLHKTMLSMAGVTQSVFVRPTFRCIVLEDQEELKSSVLPPMINRFSKTVLTYASALNHQQSKTRTALATKCQVQIDKEHVINILEFLIPGLSMEGLDSAIYAYSAFDEVIRRLCYCFSRKNLRRLSLKLVEGLNDLDTSVTVGSWYNSWKVNRCDVSFEGLAKIALRGRKHLMVITEQLQLDARSLASTLERVFSLHNVPRNQSPATVTMAPGHMTILNQATSSDVYAALTTLKRHPTEGNAHAIAVFILDTTSTSQSVQLDSFMYAVSSEALDDRHHVVLITVVSDFIAASASSPQKPTAQSQFSIVYDASWGQLLADEVVPRHIGLVPGENLQCSLLDELEKDAYLHDILKPELILALALQPDNLTSLCQCVSSSTTSVSHNVEVIKQLLSNESPLRDSIVELVIQNTQTAQVQFERWSKLAFQKAKYSSDSLRAIYLDYLGSYVLRVLVQIMTNLVQFDCLSLAENADMADIISELIRSPLVPACDTESCLNLAPFPMTRGADVASSKGYFLFPRSILGQPTKVSFPMSPFIVKRLFDLGLDRQAIVDFVKSVKLDQITATELELYLQDAICIGLWLKPARLPLLKSIVKIFCPTAFDSVVDFHCFVAENQHWLKATLRFSALDFSAAAIEGFNGECIEDLVKLAAVEGVIPLARVDLLNTVTKNDESIKWNLIRAMAMTDAIRGRSAEEMSSERAILVELHAIFVKSTADGIVALFEKAPYHFLKYFLFELFSGDCAVSEIINNTLTSLSAQKGLPNLLDPNEGIRCGIAFLLRRAFTMYFSGNDEVVASLSAFIMAGPSQYVLASHCAFDVVCKEQVLSSLDSNDVSRFEGDTPFFHFIRLVLAFSVLFDIMEEEDADAEWCLMLSQLLQNNKEDIREATLFVLRQLTKGGTVEIEKAVAEIRSAKFPAFISECSVVDEVSKALQRVSPLACNTGFASAVAALSEYAASKKNEILDRFNAVDQVGKMVCIATHCVGVAPQSIPAFQADIYPVVVGQVPQPAVHVLQRLSQNPKVLAKPDKFKELILGFFCGVLNDNKALVFYKDLAENVLKEKKLLTNHRNNIQELMIPKCPRCQKAFIDWSGCFSVYCSCGCSFCGHCLVDCGSDAHPHVQAQHGGYYGTLDQFRSEFGVIALGKIRNYMLTVPAGIKPLLEAELPRILAGNVFSVRPEQILTAAPLAGTRPRDAIAHVGTFLDMLSCAGYIWHSITADNSDADPLDTLFQTLEGHIHSLNKLLFPDATSDAGTYSWIHAMMWKLAKLDANVTRAAIQNAVQGHCQTYIDPLALLMEFDQTCRSHLSGILSELQATEKGVINEKPFDDACRRTLLALPRTLYNFKNQFWAHVKSNYDNYPVLNVLRERESSLTKETMKRSLEILDFLNKLTQAAREKRMSRAKAEQEGSFHAFVKEYGEPLVSLLPAFEANFVAAFKKTTHYQCEKDMHKLYEHMLDGIPDTTPLASFLPQKKGTGILGMALWEGRNGDDPESWWSPPNVQNKLYSAIHGAPGNASVNPFFLNEKDLVTVDVPSIVDLINELFVVPGYQPVLSEDLPVAEALCKYGEPRLASFPPLVSELPEYSYGLEGIMDLFATIQNRLSLKAHPSGEGTRDFVALSSNLTGSVKALIQRVPHAADLIYSFCGAVLVHQGSEDVPLGREVAEIDLQMPLTEEQRQGRQTLFELPTALKSFHVDHIPALMGLCWNSQNLHETANVPMEEGDDDDDDNGVNAIKATFKRILETPDYHRQIPTLLASLRAAGVCFFSTDTNFDADTPLHYYLTMIPVPLVEDEEYSPPFSTEAKHFGTVLREAERILGPHELSTPVLDTCIVPFAAVRQFLQTHIVEETKPTTTTTKPLAVVAPAAPVAAPAPAQRPQQQASIIVKSSASALSELEL